jgi:hypothetical protein
MKLFSGISLEELDGRYEIRSETSDGGPYRINADGMTEVKSGRTSPRKDQNGLVWESSFSVAGRKRIAMESTCDPSQADEEVYIKDGKNNLTRNKVTYRGELEVRRIGDRLVLQGEIRHGIVTTRLTMTKIG